MFTFLQFLFFCLLSFCGILHGQGTGGQKVLVKEGDNVVLPCSLSTKEDIEFKLFDWKKAAQKDERQKEVFMYDAGVHYNNGRDGQSEQFKGRVSHFPEELKHGNASITIRNTKVTDSGNYTCDFPRLQPRQTFKIELVVDPILRNRRGETSAATPKPYITTLNATDLWALLQCEVSGAFPEPGLEWRDGAGNKLPAEEPQVSEREGRSYITLNATVTKTGNYHCIVTQETISHQISAQTFVYISDATPKPYIRILSGPAGSALLQCEVRGAFPEPAVEWRDSSGNKLPAEELQVSEREGRFYITLNANVTKTGDYHCIVTQETISHQISAEISVDIDDKVSEGSSSTAVGCLCFFGGFLGASVLAAVLVQLVDPKYYTIRRKRGPRDTQSVSGDPDSDISLTNGESPPR